MNTIEKLKKKENFTGVEISLADYILKNIDHVQNMSLQELAAASYVSKPSAIRLYRKLGFKNYREFSVALQVEKIRYQEDFESEMAKAFDKSSAYKDVAVFIGKLAKKIVDQCLEAIDEDILEKIVVKLAEAGRIYVYPVGEYQTAALSFINRMSMVGRYPAMIDSAMSINGLAESCRKEDVIVVVSSSDKVSERDIHFAEVMENCKASKILVTAYQAGDSCLDKKENFVDHRLFTYPESDDPIRNNPFALQMSLLLGMNIIYGCLLKYDREHKA
ncbi:MAG: MurR/RpiR family transcriptional regulator [Erysipelotrichaceae bacterium]|nr:MurR/RpiR family transcriptional regulator [Erysipelotrichaceae bacterium]